MPKEAPQKTRRRPLTIEEAAEYLNTTPRFVRRLHAERRIVAIRLGGAAKRNGPIRFDPDDLDAHLDSSKLGTA